MKKPKQLFCTSEYIEALSSEWGGNTWHCKGKEFILFDNYAAADFDAQWLVDHWKKSANTKIKKPTIYKVRFEKIKVNKVK